MRFSSLIFLPLAATAFSPAPHGVARVPPSAGANSSLRMSAQDGGSGMTAREARIVAPASAISAAVLGTALPGIDAAQAVYDPFETSCRQYFPASLPSSKVSARVVSTLKARGYTDDNTLLASSLCSDEVNDTPLSLFGGLQSGLAKAKSGGVFNLGGLGGVPFVGPSGFGAFFSHCPKEGRVVIVYGPHVGISSDGVVGKIERIGMEKPSGACGAALGAYKAIKAEREKADAVRVGEVLEGFPYAATQPDVQEDFIIRDLRARLESNALDGPDQNALIAMVTNKMYDMVSDLLLREVDGAIKKPGFWDKITEVTLLGGLVINRGNPQGLAGVEDYFKPITFQSLSRAPGTANAVVTDNLLSYLYDESSLQDSLMAVAKPKINQDTINGAAVAAGVIGTGAVIGSISSNNDNDKKPPPRKAPAKTAPKPAPAKSAPAKSAPALNPSPAPTPPPFAAKERDTVLQ